MEQWTPLYDKILVRRLPPPEAIRGMHTPDVAKEDQNVGIVLKVGDGRPVESGLRPLVVKPGLEVLFSRFSGIQVDDQDPNLLVLREDELLGWRQVSQEQLEKYKADRSMREGSLEIVEA